MKLALPLSIVALIIGYVIGTTVERHRAPATEVRAATKAPNKTPSTSKDPDIAMPPAAESLTELAKAKERIAKLESQLGKSGKEIPKPELTPEEAKAKLEELKANVPVLVAKKDGKALIKLMQEMAALGEIGYMPAIEVSGLLSADQKGKNELGLTQNEYYMAFGGSMVPVMAWGLLRGDDVPANFRAGSAWGLPWHPEVEPGKLFLEALKSEKNPEVLQAIQHNLSEVAKAGMEGELLAMVPKYAENPQMIQSVVSSLARIGTNEAAAALETMAGSSVEAIRNEAQFGMIAIHPPEPGLLITMTVPNSQAETLGIKRGDLITSYNGQPVTSLESLRAAMKTVAAGTVVTITVNRGGSSVPLQLKGGEKIGVDGQPVKPK